MDWFYDLSYPPPKKNKKNSVTFFNERFSWLLDTGQGARYEYEVIYVLILSCCGAKVYRTMASKWRGALYFRRYGRELVPKPAISLKKSLGPGLP